MFDVAVLVSLLSAQSSSEEGGGAIFGALFLLAGPAFWAYVYFRYRSVGKRHSHETEVEAKVVALRKEDLLVKTMTGITNSSLAGANSGQIEGSQLKLF